MNAAILLLATLALAAEKSGGKNELSQSITVRGKASGPALAVPPPSPSPPVVDEVLRSLSFRSGNAAAPETVRVSPETSRLERPFPEPPLLSLTPRNIRALYDSWRFEVRSEDGAVAARSEGVGLLREKLEWDGSSPDGRLSVVAGRRYLYVFTGRRGAREFSVQSDPVEIKSFAHRDWAGEKRLEVALDEIFSAGKAERPRGAARYLEALADALRSGDARADGTFHLELYQRDPRGKLAAARVKALQTLLSSALLTSPAKVQVRPLPVERGEALAAFVPAPKGARLRNE